MVVAAVVSSLVLLVVEAEHGFLGEAGEAQSRTFPALLLPHQVTRQGKVYRGWDLFSLKLKLMYVSKEQNVLTALSVPISTEAAATQVPAAPAGIPAAAKQPPATTIPAATNPPATAATTIPAAAWQLAAAEISVSAEEAKDKAAFSAT